MLLIALAIKDFLKVLKKQPEANDRKRFINFIPAGRPPPVPRAAINESLLTRANDWSVCFDLPEFRTVGSKYVFPHEVCATPLKIDGHLVSRKTKTCIGIELTCPMEENISVWHQAKLLKYDEEIRSEAQRNGWTFHSVIIEVGARGWIPHGVRSALTRLGLPSVNTLCHNLSHIALKSSYVIWLNRWNKDFQPWRLEKRNLQQQSLISRPRQRTDDRQRQCQGT